MTLGIHPKAYLTSLRIRHAKTMLTETKKNILCVMGESGFETISAFYDAFKRETGMSPGQYRKSASLVVPKSPPEAPPLTNFT